MTTYTIASSRPTYAQQLKCIATLALTIVALPFVLLILRSPRVNSRARSLMTEAEEKYFGCTLKAERGRLR
ncbi:hypothetical protein BaRGS_00001667 [Batillaria attramentaria]|uniref:Uncharacterized protein n=1 Tax=Batillaria attramentaria TaxID=370345 RepID=A0ABD0M4Z9_9CAEN